MNRLLLTIAIGLAALSGLVAGVLLAHQRTPRLALVSATASAFVPACPRPSYSADGNVWPIFCKIDNPLALRFYESLAPRVFALGPAASPQQVERALAAADAHATGPEMCAVYQLAAWWRHWHFGVDPGYPYCG